MSGVDGAGDQVDGGGHVSDPKDLEIQGLRGQLEALMLRVNVLTQAQEVQANQFFQAAQAAQSAQAQQAQQPQVP